jgi:thiamine biosynthesis lipoprotein
LIFFDTVCELSVFSSAYEFSEAIEEVKKIFSSLEEDFGPEYMNVKSEKFDSLLKESLNIHKKTNGYFDITIGPLKEAWGFLNGDYRVPSKEEIDELLKRVGMEKIQTQNDEIFIPEKVRLDWGAIAKGYGVDLASKTLIKMNIKKGFLNAGGDIYCWGKNPDGLDWRIGIKHPRKKGYLGVLQLSNLGAATSGDYQRFFVKEGKRYHHIFNPFTGYPAQGKQSVTVIGPEVILCDALSTAVFVSDEPDEILKRYPEYGAVIVSHKGQVFCLGKRYKIELNKESL